MTPLSADAVFSCYEYLLDHSRYVDWNEHFRQWGWEFLRRREEYRADWTNDNHTAAKEWGLAALVDPDSDNPPEFTFPQHWDRIVLTSDLEVVDGAESAQNAADARRPQYRPDSWRNALLARDLRSEGRLEREIGDILEPHHAGGPVGARDKGRDSLKRFEKLSKLYLQIAFGHF